MLYARKTRKALHFFFSFCSPSRETVKRFIIRRRVFWSECIVTVSSLSFQSKERCWRKSCLSLWDWRRRKRCREYIFWRHLNLLFRYLLSTFTSRASFCHKFSYSTSDSLSVTLLFICLKCEPLVNCNKKTQTTVFIVRCTFSFVVITLRPLFLHFFFQLFRSPTCILVILNNCSTSLLNWKNKTYPSSKTVKKPKRLLRNFGRPSSKHKNECEFLVG